MNEIALPVWEEFDAEPTQDQLPASPVPEPVPLVREQAPPAPFPIEALGPLRSAVEAATGKTQAPVALAAGSALSAASLAVQGLADAEGLHGRCPCSVFILTIAKSGERKSSTDKLFMDAVKGVQSELAETYAEELLAHKAAAEVHKRQSAALSKRAEKEPEDAEEGLIALGNAPSSPLRPLLTLADVTAEGLTKAMTEMRPSLGLFNDEGGVFVGGYAMKPENRLATLGILSKFWDGAPVARARSGDGLTMLRDRRLCLHLQMQPIAAAPLFADPQAIGQGFLPRCLIAWPESTMGTRFVSNETNDTLGALKAFSKRMHELLSVPLTMTEGGGLSPRLLHLSGDARAILEVFHDDVERENATAGRYASITGFSSKSAEQAVRLAGVLALFDDPSALVIEGRTMRKAAELARWYLEEALRLIDAAEIAAPIREADELRKWLGVKWSEPRISVSDIVKNGPSRLRTAEKARAAIKVLEDHGWVLPRGRGEVAGTARRETWDVSPCQRLFSDAPKAAAAPAIVAAVTTASTATTAAARTASS